MHEAEVPEAEPTGKRLRIRFEAEEPHHEEMLRSLLGWFTDDRSLRGHVQVERSVADRPGRMGPELEAVLALISTAVGVVQLPLSFLAWQQSRKHGTPPPPVTIQVIGADDAETEALLRRLRGEAADDGTSGEPRT